MYCPLKQLILVLQKVDHCQLNIPAATAENEEQYTYSNILYMGFQNSYSFFEIFLDKQMSWKGRQISWKLLVVEFIFW